MHSLKQDLLFLIVVRDCYNLKLLLNPNKFRLKFLRALTIIKKSDDGTQWYINGNVVEPFKKILTKIHYFS